MRPDVLPRSTARQNRERVMAAIHAAAIAEFSEKGLSGTSTQAIAARAGLTKPQLHYYIKGKEELYEELLMSVMSDWKGMFDAGSTDPGKVLDGGRNLEKFWPDSHARTREKANIINGWIARGLMKPVDPYVLLMSIW